jgi:oligopeptide/dipeptide ABC transporter ATP-binding protein
MSEVPSLAGSPRQQAEPLLEVRDLHQEFTIERRGRTRGAVVHAVSGVSFELGRQETVGVVGETGCGKSSLARAILQAPRPTAGEVWLAGENLVTLRGAELRRARRKIQMVFQDPYSSLDPLDRAVELIAEPLAVHRIAPREERQRRAKELMERVGLDPGLLGNRRPRELSGGQCQRVAIARALALRPDVVIFDEAVSSLDVSVQAQVLNLLEDLRDDLGLSYVFIAHDLNVVRLVSDRIAVMYLGKFCETAPSDELYQTPHHPYSVALIGSIPGQEGVAEFAGEDIDTLGEMPSPLDPPSGCRFRTRCPFAREVCAEIDPPLLEVAPGRSVACHFPLNLSTTPTSRGQATASRGM